MRKRILLLTLLAGALLGTAASAQTRWAVVNLSANYMHQAPDYESALETQALMGTVVEIIAEQGYWRQVVQHDPPYVAWTTELGLAEMRPDELDLYMEAPKYICTAFTSKVYGRPSLRSEPLSDLVMGDLVRMVINDKGRAVRSLGFCQVLLPDGRSGYVRTQDLADFPAWAEKCNPKPAALEKTARQMLGIPYMWGGTSVKSLDCSGFVWMVYYMNGILLPRNASQQAHCGIEVPLNRLKAGDLIFFGTPGYGDTPDRIAHVGISLGGKQFIHASHVVRVSSLDPASPDYYNSKTPLFACRIVERGTLTEGGYYSRGSRNTYGYATRSAEEGEEGATNRYFAIPVSESPWYF